MQQKNTVKKVAIVHYWLTSMRGGERVLESFCNIFPAADIYTLVLDEKSISQTILQHKIYTSFLQKIGGKRHYTKMLPLMPFAIENFDLTKYDLIISSESGPAKGIIPAPDALHVCYCHSPMRYIWDLQYRYLESAGIVSRLLMSLLFPFLRVWDQSTSTRVDEFIANSSFVQKRILKYYKRSAVVINPPVDVSRFQLNDETKDYYLYVGQITPYKRVDIIIDAFVKNGKKLIIAGSGATTSMLKTATDNIQFIHSISDEEIATLYTHCKALIFPALEDFGIVPLEAQASGRPVIAYGRGGALDTVIPGVTGHYFHEQTSDALNGAIEQFESSETKFDKHQIRNHALRFSKERFEAELRTTLSKLLLKHGHSPSLYNLESTHSVGTLDD
jgi:glycosyltransferase involved in cell wall biosynthesis